MTIHSVTRVFFYFFYECTVCAYVLSTIQFQKNGEHLAKCYPVILDSQVMLKKGKILKIIQPPLQTRFIGKISKLSAVYQ